jgi:hypothetical protein
MAMSLWYHGTTRGRAALIQATGLTASYYGKDFQGFGEPLHTLRKLREHVASWYAAVVDLDVPDDEAPEYLTCFGTPKCCAGTMSGLLQPLPTRMVSAIEYVS